MKNTYRIAMLGAVLAVTAGIVSTGAFSEQSASTQSDSTIPSSSLAILGHDEFIVSGEDGYVKSYLQTDNVVTEKGRDCVAHLIFKNGTANSCSLSASYTGFRYMAIGNGTDTVGVTNTALSTTSGQEVARSSALEPTFTAASSNSNKARAALSNAFSIDDGIGSTTIRDSGLFDANSGGNIFAILNIPNSGVAVQDGDTLTVNWTVDIG